MSRNLQDALLIKSSALPAANASNATASIDLTATTQDESPFEVSLSVPATPNLADTKKITFTFEDSADNSSFAAIAPLATLVVTGTASGGAAAERIVRLPGVTRRYIRASAAVESAGGTNTAVSYTLGLIF